MSAGRVAKSVAPPQSLYGWICAHNRHIGGSLSSGTCAKAAFTLCAGVDIVSDGIELRMWKVSRVC